MSELTKDRDGAVEIETAYDIGGEVIGTIIKRKGAYYFLPTEEFRVVLGRKAARKIADRLEELTNTVVN